MQQKAFFFTGKERSDSSLHARSVCLSRLRLGGKDYAARVESVTFQSYMTDGGICFYENTKCKGNPWQDDKKIGRMTESRQWCRFANKIRSPRFLLPGAFWSLSLFPSSEFCIRRKIIVMCRIALPRGEKAWTSGQHNKNREWRWMHFKTSRIPWKRNLSRSVTLPILLSCGSQKRDFQPGKRTGELRPIFYSCSRFLSPESRNCTLLSPNRASRKERLE